MKPLELSNISSDAVLLTSVYVPPIWDDEPDIIRCALMDSFSTLSWQQLMWAEHNINDDSLVFKDDIDADSDCEMIIRGHQHRVRTFMRDWEARAKKIAAEMHAEEDT